jgi:hypothetical protein
MTMDSSKKLQAVVIRSYSGVFFGYLKAKRGGGEHFDVDLVSARHIWNWQSAGLPRKALTVEDLAILGAGDGTKISGAVNLSIADVKVIVEAHDDAVARFEALPCL